MSMNVAPVKAAMAAVNSVVPKSKVSKALNLGESIMSRQDERTSRAKNIVVAVIKTFADKAKAKPDAERTVIDYILIVADKLKDINPMKYAA